MKINQIISVLVLGLTLSSCGKLNKALDIPSQMDKTNAQIEKTNAGMAETNEAIRLQKLDLTLKSMTDSKNRKALTPIPFDMNTPAKIFGEAIHADEMLLFAKNYIKKINEYQFSDAYPELDSSDEKNAEIVKEFYTDKYADYNMLAAISGFLKQSTVDEMVSTQAAQGAYRKELMSILMLRAFFNDALMLRASVLNESLETLGSIEKAIEYNEIVEKIVNYQFAGFIKIKITGFSSDSGINGLLSKQLDKSSVAKNWQEIYNKAQNDFSVMSYSSDASEIQSQKDSYNKLMNKLKSKVESTKDLLPKNP